MALARVVYTQSVNGNKNFTVPFPYISRDHVKVTVNGAPASFTWINTNTVQINPAPAVGAVVEIRRVTERRNLLVDFKDGSTITETDLDLLALQNFYLSQEADDLAEESNGIANAAASTANAAITTANAASSAAASAVATANSAKDTANTALANANNAVSTANNALSIANTASSNASAAVATANAAQTAANSAISTANSAKDTANSAVSQATTAVSTANTAAQNAATALSKANTALANSETAISTANTALNKAAAAEGAATTASNAAQSAANSANAAATKAQQLETQFNNLLASVEQIAGADLSDFAKNSDNLAYLTDKAAARANLGLGNVDNTSDLDKPVSLATQAALATKADVRHTHSVGEVSGLGTAATADLTTSVIDTTQGRVLKFGDFGVGAGVQITNSNLDNLKIAGFYYASNCTNAPENSGSVFVSGTITQPVQLWVGTDSGKVFVRKFKTGVGWSPWQEIYHSGNLGAAIVSTGKWGIARTLTIGNTSKSVDGSADVSWSLAEIGATNGLGDYIVRDTRNANTPTSLGDRGVRYEFKINATDGLNDGGLYHGVMTFQPWGDSSGGNTHQLGFTNNGNLWLRTAPIGGTWGPWRKICHSGNLGDAIVSTGKWGIARTLTIGNTSKSVDGSANVSWSLDEIGAARFGFLSQTNLNNAINPGFYRLEGGLTNAPPDVQYGQLIVARGGSDTIFQIVTGYNNGEIYWRQGNPPEVGGRGFWGPWHKFLHSGNIGPALRVAFNAPGDAPAFVCRAWANFNGTGAVRVRGSGNVSSITYNGTGDYTINFMVAMPDANYAAIGTCGGDDIVTATNYTPTSVRIRIMSDKDNSEISVAIFR